MNPRLLVLRLHLPAFVRRSILTELVDATARAFGAPPRGREGPCPSCWCARSSSRALRPRCREQLGRSRTGRATPVLRGPRVGSACEGAPQLKTEAEGLAAARVLYGAIGIDFRPGRARDIVVPSCAFAPAYGPQVCRLMSSMDSGLVAGLTGADGIRFTERITEGAVACRAPVVHAGGAP